MSPGAETTSTQDCHRVGGHRGDRGHGERARGRRRNGDAGSLPATAQIIPGPVETITGSLATLDQEDVYRLCLAGGRTFSATTAGSEIADTQLFLFDATGRGVYANDDDAGGLQSTLPADLTFTPTRGGIYYLGVSSFDADPVSATGPVFEGEVFIDDVRYWVPIPPGGDEPVNDWTLFGTYTDGYQVHLTGTTSGCPPTTKAECKNNGWQPSAPCSRTKVDAWRP
jgi:hypothetical protein